MGGSVWRMAGASLLTRIRFPELAVARRSVSEDELRASILANLSKMIHTRLGTMLTQPDYGIADVSEMVHAFPDAIVMMARSLRTTIQQYEPRLSQVQVIHIPNEGLDLTLRYEIRAQMACDGIKSSVKFETRLDASRKLTVK